jgi:prepilin-type N-terminal cleavage/methylation domain-containing protein
MSDRGFTLVELLVASLLTLLLMAAALTVAAAARQAFDVEPAALDTVRRLREGTEGLAGVLMAAGGGLATGDGVSSLASNVPLVRPLTSLTGAPDSRFTALWVLRAIEGGLGRLASPQPGPGGSLTLDRASSPCALTTAVCGFDIGDVAVVFDERGHFDVLEVAAVSELLSRITPAAPLSYAYDTGAWVLAVRVDRFGLVRQVDGSQTLTRLSWAGAREPMVDGVVDLEVRAWGKGPPPEMRDADVGPGLAQYGLHPPEPLQPDPDNVFVDGTHCMVMRTGGAPSSRLASYEAGAEGLVSFGPTELSDGPWCPAEGWPGAFDADLFRLSRIDLRLRVEVQSAEFRGPAGSLFTRGGTAGRNAPRWVLDRTLETSVSLGR